MDILVLGRTGFIGGRVAHALEASGHRVLAASHATHDLARLTTAAAWQPLLAGCDGVVNAVGLFRESGADTFAAVHVAGPAALFEACARLAIPVVQVSALGADVAAPTAFLRSKGEADARLLALRGPATILRPSLVFGSGGASAAAFLVLASMPWVPLPGRGEPPVQPVHVDDVAHAVVRAFAAGPRGIVDAVGQRPLALREYLAALRRGLGLGGPRFFAVPSALVRLAARLRLGLLDRDALAMLERGSTADAGAFAALLGRAPRPVEAFVEAREARSLRMQALLGWLLPLLRGAIAIVWLSAGVVSAGLYPVEQSRAMLAQVGLAGPAATLALFGAVALDTVLGVATLVLKRRHWLWNAQLALILAYTGIITVFLPEQWLHPFGPVVKNLPMLAAILLLREMERR